LCFWGSLFNSYHHIKKAFLCAFAPNYSIPPEYDAKPSALPTTVENLRSNTLTDKNEHLTQQHSRYGYKIYYISCINGVTALVLAKSSNWVTWSNLVTKFIYFEVCTTVHEYYCMTKATPIWAERMSVRDLLLV